MLASLRNLDLFWRYFLTGLLGIFLAAFATFFLIGKLETADSRAGFSDDASYIYSMIESGKIEPNANHTAWKSPDDELPYIINRASKSSLEPLNKIVELGNNRFQITRFSDKYGHAITVTDLKDNLDEELSPEEIWLETLSKIAVILAIVTFLGFGFYLLNKRTDQHIQRLVKASEQVSIGNFDVDIPLDSPQPIRQLAEQLETAKTNIQTLIDKEKTLAFAIPHELRTPLSKLRLALDLSRKNKTVEDYESLVEDLDAYTDELEGIIENLMQLAKTNEQLHTSPIKIKDKLEEYKQDFLLLYPNKNILIESPLKVIHSCEPPLDIILKNLFENACKYSDQEVNVSVKQTGENVELTFANDGQEIPQGLKDKIFTPFFRLEESRTREQGGVGLGLALVKQAAEQLQGKVKLVDSDNWATMIHVVLKA